MAQLSVRQVTMAILRDVLSLFRDNTLLDVLSLDTYVLILI